MIGDLPGCNERTRGATTGATHPFDYIPVAGVVLLVLLVCLAYASSIKAMVDTWSNDGFGHGYLIPVVFLFLLWHERAALARSPIKPSWLGVLLVILAVWIWFLARFTLVQIVEHIAILAIMHALTIAVLGWSVYVRSAFALTYLALAVPAGMDIIPWLVELTAILSHEGLRLLGIPALREGAFFMLPGGTFEVAESCSGYRYVFSGLALSTLVAYLDIRAWYWRIGFVMFAMLCFILLNSVRATLIMAIASASDMRYLADDHEWFGWLLFAILAAALYLLALRLNHAR